MNYKHCCVIDTRKVYKTLVLVISRENTKPDESVSLESEVQHYAMLPGETLIETAPPPMRFHAGTSGFIKPKWDSAVNCWAEAAAPDEITAWETEHPAPPAPAPTAQEQLRADVDYIAAMTGVSL